MSKYCPEIVEEITNNLRLGLGRVDCVDLSGICYDTFLEWIAKYPEFAEAIKKAEKQCKQRCLAIIQKAAIETWQAAAWLLERKYKDEFSLRQENTGANGEPMKIEFIVPKEGLFANQPERAV